MVYSFLLSPEESLTIDLEFELDLMTTGVSSSSSGELGVEIVDVDTCDFVNDDFGQFVDITSCDLLDIEGFLFEDFVNNGSSSFSTGSQSLEIGFDDVGDSIFGVRAFLSNEVVAVPTPEPASILSLLTIGGIVLGASKEKQS